jgi:hypothetical protein
MRVQSCYFCRGSAENTVKGGREFACCRKCCIERLLPLIAAAVGPVELAQAANRLATDPGAGAGSGPKPMVPDTDKISRLFYGRGAEMSRGTGRPAAPGRPRRMTKAEQAMAIARYQARQNNEVIPQDIERMVRRAGLRVNGGGGAELSTATAGGGTRTTAQPAGKTAPPSKKEIAEMIRRAGLGVA